MPEDGTTVGVWVGKSDDIIEEFDAAIGDAPRSGKIKEAMRMYLVVDESLGNADVESVDKAVQMYAAIEDVLESADIQIPREPSKRHWVGQAIQNEAARDAMQD